jgi:tetratricopeptide (TPR) repeat protein
MKSLYLCTFCVGILSVTAAAQDLDRGIELYRKNDFAAAASTLRPVVDTDGSNARANRYLGLALLEQGNASEAEPFILKASELDPGGESKTAQARLYIEKKDYEKAADALKDAGGEELPYVRGLLALNRKQYEQAARALESFSKSYPDFAYAHYYAGLAYNGMKRPDKMLTQFEMFVKMKPDAPEARKVRSVLRTGQ